MTAPVEVKSVPVTLDAVGTVETIASVAIRSQVTGQLRDVGFEPGQDVRKGQPLFSIDPRPFEAALRQAEAVVARDTAQADDAASRATREKNLFDRGLIPRDQYDAQVASADALKASLAADQAQVDQARLNLQYTNIAAPTDGRTGALMAHVGDLVRANDTNPLVTINQLSPIYVTFSVPARYLTEIRERSTRDPLEVIVQGQAAPGSQDSDAAAESESVVDPGAGGGEGGVRMGAPGLGARGKVTFIDNAVDPATATIKLKGTFPNANHDLWPGLFVKVELQLSSEPNAVVVPATAVQPSQQGPYVYVVKPDRTVAMQPVAVERQQGPEIVVAGGLKGGEQVVTEGQLRLTPGAHVTTGGGATGTP